MIKNKFKLGYFVLTVAIAGFMPIGIANAAELTFTADYTVDLSSPDINLTILSGSEADSLVVDTDRVQVIVGNNDVFTITSSGRQLSATGDTTSDVNITNCSGGLSTVSITGGPDGETITIMPGSVCSSGGGGGGGGSSADTTAPTNTSISINGGAASTSTIAVTLTLNATDGDEMMISNSSSFSGESWENYVTSKSWTLTSGDGTKTVYAKFRDSDDNTSSTISDTITLSGSGAVATTVTTTTTTATTAPQSECRFGDMFSATSGKPCPAAPVGCTSTTAFSPITGAQCPVVTTSTTSTTTTTTSTTAPPALFIFTRDLFWGLQNDNDVMELQKRLISESCYIGAINGNFDEATIEAVKCFQRKYNFSFVPPGGYVGPYTRKVLNEGGVATVTAAGTAYVFTRDLTIGSTGADVSVLQSFLISRGFARVPYVFTIPTGYFGVYTKAAVSAWQLTVGLDGQGFFDSLSRAKMAM